MTDKLAFSIDETAQALSISRNAVKDLIYTGKIKVIRVGRRVLIPRWSLDEFLADAESAAPGPDVDWDKMLREA